MKYFLLTFFVIWYKILFAQSGIIKLSYKKYMEVALNTNNSLKAAQCNLPIADAKISVAKILPDPVISLGNVSWDMSGKSLPSQWFGGVSQKFELGSKRKVRMDIAMAEMESSKAKYANFIRVFKLEASEKFIDALIAQMIYEKELLTYNNTKGQLEGKRNDSLSRLEHFKINVALGEMLNQVYDAEMQLKITRLDLSSSEGAFLNESNLRLEGDLYQDYKKYSIDSLISVAKEIRPDLQESRLEQNKWEQEKNMIRANRKIDIDLGIGDNFYTKANNEIAPAPAYHAMLVTIAFPLKISNFHKEQMLIAEHSKTQSEQKTASQELLMEIEIKQAFVRYEIAYREMSHYKNNMLKEVDWALETELANYKLGKSSFIEFSEASRKLDEVYIAYYRTLKNYAYSLVELEYASGIWDISF